jgi:hypothetical protein
VVIDDVGNFVDTILGVTMPEQNNDLHFDNLALVVILRNLGPLFYIEVENFAACSRLYVVRQ